ISALAKPGASIVTFCPCKRAWFARLNRVLPESLKRAILFAVFPEKRERQGFPAYYDGCSPSEMTENMAAAGVSVTEIRYFYVGYSFMCFVPLYILWGMINYPLIRMFPALYCETFIFVGTRNGCPQCASCSLRTRRGPCSTFDTPSCPRCAQSDTRS